MIVSILCSYFTWPFTSEEANHEKDMSFFGQEKRSENDLFSCKIGWHLNLFVLEFKYLL